MSKEKMNKEWIKIKIELKLHNSEIEEFIEDVMERDEDEYDEFWEGDTGANIIGDVEAQIEEHIKKSKGEKE